MRAAFTLEEPIRLTRGAIMRITAISAACLALVSISMATEVEAAIRRTTVIQAQGLAPALETLAKQRDFQILYVTSVVNGLRTDGAVGEFTDVEAIERLLSGTGLTYRYVDDETVMVMSAADTAPASTPAASASQSGGVRPPVSETASDSTSNQEVESRKSDRSAEKNPSGNSEAQSQESESETNQLNEVLVTGTHIRGDAPVGAPVLVFDRTDIKNSGYGTTQEFVRSIPQNFGGGLFGASEDGVIGPGVNSALNNEAGTGINLRGLGANSTLTLLNGRRMAPSGTGSFVDVSIIPIGAIERIDILTDGASAIYGADAIAGVVNFVLRRDYEGAETAVRYGASTDGSPVDYSASQTLGTNWTDGGVLISGEFRRRDALTTADRNFTVDAPRPTDILPETEEFTIIGSVHHRLSDWAEVFFDGLYSDKDVERRSATDFSFQRAGTETRSGNLSAGVTLRPFADWQFQLSATHGFQRLRGEWFEIDPVPFGYVFGEPNVENEYDLSSFDLVSDGTLFRIPGGEVRLAIGVGHRREELSSVPYSGGGGLPIVFERTVDAQFAEMRVPLVSEQNAMPLIYDLALSAAVRREDYSDFGETTNPKFAASWSPTADLTIRASWGTSFRAPSAIESSLQESGVGAFNFLFASPDGSTLLPVLLLFGSDPSLRPEEADVWTAGFDVTPESLAGLRLSASYFHVDFRDRIITPPFDVSVLQNLDVYGSLVSTFADDAAAAAFVQTIVDGGGQFFDVLGTGTTGIRYLYSQQQQNAAVVEQDGVDVGASFEFDLGSGRLIPSFNAAIIRRIDTAFTEDSTPTDLVNTYGNPSKLRLRGALSWRATSYDLNAALNYVNSYDDTTALTPTDVDSSFTLDLAAQFRPAVLNGVIFDVSIVNAFNSDPPYTTGGPGLTGVHYDVGNADPIGRFISLGIRKIW